MIGAETLTLNDRLIARFSTHAAHVLLIDLPAQHL
jgi:hypothetical protein